MGRPWVRWVAFSVASVCWFAATALVALATLIADMSGDLWCEAPPPADSNYGESSWSWMPLGPTCTFTRAANGVDLVRGPGPWWTIAWAVVIFSGVLVIRAGYRLTTRTAEPDAPARVRGARG